MNKIFLFSWVILSMVHLNLPAQHSILSAGSDGTGSGGTISCSTGQVAYTFIAKGFYILGLGVQQAEIEETISSLTNPFETEWNINVYPNPTLGMVTIENSEADKHKLDYWLYDTNAKLLDSGRGTGKNTVIDLSRLPLKNYILKIRSGNKQKIVQLIKN